VDHRGTACYSNAASRGCLAGGGSRGKSGHVRSPNVLAATLVLGFLAVPVTARAGEPRRRSRPHATRSATPRRRPPPPPPAPPRAVPEEPVPYEVEPPGFAGRRLPRTFPARNLVPLPDRWRIGLPEYDRYPGTPGERQLSRGHWWDPYHQNILKGDYPIFGQKTFFAFTGVSDTLIEGRKLPTPSDVSSARSGSKSFFGEGESISVDQNFLLSFDLFHGDAGFKPRDWELRATPVFNLNYLAARENGVANVDVRRGTERQDSAIALQELFADVKLADVSPAYDTVHVRGGIQGFVSDFRGFLFNDNTPGLKFSGTAAANRIQWNVAWFHEIEKDTNSGLNTIFKDRKQDVAVADVLRQDTLWPGYTARLSLHYNDDRGGRHFDENGFLARPAAFGDVRQHTIRVGYLGWTGDGHIQRVGVSHAFYQAIGRDTHNQLAGREVDVDAQMAALELSYDRDWLRFHGSGFWASGDGNPTDGKGRGFDAIFDEPDFAGGPFSFWQRQGIRLAGTNVALVDRGSLLPTLRSSKNEGQANFVNPGVFILNAGLSAKLKPKLTAEVNVNYIRFQEVAPLQEALLQRTIGHDVGVDYSLGLVYRPLLVDNVRLVAGVAGLSPLGGFADIYGSRTLWQAFGAATLTF
jgi:hypothetical protein